MKKSVIALILLAVLIIIVSPGIVGKMAENSVGENLNWAANESGDLIVTTNGFSRSWFSSEGQHRIELAEGGLRTAMMALVGSGGYDQIPVLLINTRIDHGLIPVTSMSRKEGSLAPGLGSAVSTLGIELAANETIDVPGTIYSTVDLSGDLDSRYILEAGATTVDGGEVTWQPTTINVAADPETGKVKFDGTVGAMTFGNDQQVVSIESLTFAGHQAGTQYGFRVGEVDMSMGEMSINSNGMAAGGMQGLNIRASSVVNDGRADGSARLEMSGQTIPGFGDISVIADVKFGDLEAVALGVVSERLEGLARAADPAAAIMTAEEEFKDLFAAGLDVGVSQFDVALPMGTVEMKMALAVPASDRASFAWTSLLLSAVGSLYVTVPEALVQLATSMNPQVGAIVGMGYLKKDGDVYIMDVDMKKGLLTINGAPVPIPLGAFQ
ncbi:MAG: DUF945 family protein [Woeseiaceae bacterium]|nr:DUF945 family protein [Woeseiaceae bacterium]